MSKEQYANNATATLNGAITSGATSLQVSSASAFPSSGNFRILIDSEILLVTAVSGTTFTVTRGAESSTAAAHSNGATVSHILTAGGLYGLPSQMVLSDIGANLPSSAYQGRMYLTTDSPVMCWDSGSAWSNFGPLFPLTPPQLGNWSWANQGSATATQYQSGIVIRSPKASGDSLNMLVKAYPTAPFFFTIAVICNWINFSNARGGLVIYDSVGGKLVDLALYAGGSEQQMVWINGKWNSTTSYNANYNTEALTTTTISLPPGLVYWLQLHDDGTNRKWSVSNDGISFVQVAHQGNTDFVTPNKIGFYTNGNTTSYFDVPMHVVHSSSP